MLMSPHKTLKMEPNLIPNAEIHQITKQEPFSERKLMGESQEMRFFFISYVVN